MKNTFKKKYKATDLDTGEELEVVELNPAMTRLLDFIIPKEVKIEVPYKQTPQDDGNSRLSKNQ